MPSVRAIDLHGDTVAFLERKVVAEGVMPSACESAARGNCPDTLAFNLTHPVAERNSNRRMTNRARIGLEIQCPALGRERGFVDRFAERGVGVDGVDDFLGGCFEASGQAHLGDEFGDVLADHVAA